MSLQIESFSNGAKVATINGVRVWVRYNTGDIVEFDGDRVWRITHADGKQYTFGNRGRT